MEFARGMGDTAGGYGIAKRIPLRILVQRPGVDADGGSRAHRLAGLHIDREPATP